VAVCRHESTTTVLEPYQHHVRKPSSVFTPGEERTHAVFA
jgi:hypothetical protein